MASPDDGHNLGHSCVKWTIGQGWGAGFHASYYFAPQGSHQVSRDAGLTAGTQGDATPPQS